MKAIIVEIKDNYAAVLSDDGCITKIKNNQYSIGETIELDFASSPTLENSNSVNRETCFSMKKGANTMSKKLHISKKKFAAIASAAALCLLGAGGAKAYYTPYTYVSLDVNPSIEYSVNIFDTVIGVEATNNDGEAILDQANLDNLENKSIEEAITTTVDTIAANDYFAGDTEGGIIIATSSDDTEKSEELADTLQDTVETEVAELETENEVTVEVISVGRERVETAKSLGVTPGKLNLVEKLIESAGESNDIVLEEWLNKPVKDIMKAIKQNRKATAIETVETEEPVASTEPTATPDVTQSPVPETPEAVSTMSDDVDDDNDDATESAQKKAEKEKELAEKKAEKAKELAEKKAKKEQEQAEKAKELAEKKAEKAKELAEKKAEKAKELAEKKAEKAKELAEKKAEKEKKQADDNDDENTDDNDDDASDKDND